MLCCQMFIRYKECKVTDFQYALGDSLKNTLIAFRVDYCGDPTERLFQCFAPQKEKHFWSFADFLIGSLKFFSVL